MEGVVEYGGYGNKNLTRRLASTPSGNLSAYGLPVGVFVFNQLLQRELYKAGVAK